MFRNKADKDEADLFFNTFAGSTNGYASFLAILEKMEGTETNTMQGLAVASLSSDDARKAALIALGRCQFLGDLLRYLKNFQRSVNP